MEDFFTGDRSLNYCVKCQKVDTKPVKRDGELHCHKCSTRLRTRGAGLALSGGGYRATLFHLGGLWRLNELGWLKRLAEVTSVSGGSITAGWLGLQWKRLKFDKAGVATNFVEEVINPLREFCSHGIEGEGFICGLAQPYRRKLFGKATLQNLPSDEEGPRFTIYATSLQTGVSVRLSRPYLADYELDKKISSPHIQLATAVAASSAFPIFMRPVILRFKPSEWKDWDKKGRKGKKGRRLSRLEKRKLRSTMAITDGGVYDNLGLERVWDRYSTVLVSDAGAPFSVTTGAFWLGLNWLSIIKRADSTITEQTRRLRKRWLVNDLKEKEMRGTYWGIATEIGDYKLGKRNYPPLLQDTTKTAELSTISTRLKSFSDEKQERLINWGYALADAAMRRHVLKAGAKPGCLPYPK
jgi:NTE family protein